MQRQHLAQDYASQKFHLLIYNRMRILQAKTVLIALKSNPFDIMYPVRIVSKQISALVKFSTNSFQLMICYAAAIYFLSNGINRTGFKKI